MFYRKPRIFAWCDTPTMPTGFGIVAKNLLRDIHKKYDLEILGINYHGDERYDTNKWFIYPAAHYTDMLGFQKMRRILSKNKPDIIFLFQDIFHICDAWEIIKEEAPNSKVVIYFPVDGTPFNFFWLKPLKEADVIITYTEFAKQAILNTFPKLDGNKILTLNHGIDTDVFKPLTKAQIKESRIELGWDKKFSIINVNRFQPRKLIPLTLRACALFSKGYKKCKCGNWYWSGLDRCDLNGCGPEDVIEKVPGKKDVLLYLHMVPNEPSMGPKVANSLKAHAYNAGYRDIDLKEPGMKLQINSVDLYKEPFPDKILNLIYNAACVNISTTVGEGFGFSLAESAACGTPSIAPNHSAIPEVLGNTGHIVKNIAHFNMSFDNAHIRPIADIKSIIKALDIEYEAWLKNGKNPVKYQETIKRVKKEFNWDDKRAFIDKVFEKLIDKDKVFIE